MYDKNEFFDSTKGTLGTRVDWAWVHLNDDTADEKQKEKALDFLVFVFDLDFDIEDEKNQLMGELYLLMAERRLYKPQNPQYIPGHSPKFLDKVGLAPEQRGVQSISIDGVSTVKEVNKAIAEGDLLDVVKKSKEIDKEKKTTYLTSKQRANHQLLIKDGEFYYKGVIFDSSKGFSHSKRGFVAYTLNANGELSIFNHTSGVRLPGDDRLIFHSSMNAGSPVVAAGELRIENGKLKEITTHSGHYQPTLFNIYRALNHFDDKNVDLSDVKVLTGNQLSAKISLNSKLSNHKVFGCAVYETPAKDVVSSIRQALKENIKGLEEYKKGGITQQFFRLCGDTLTKSRESYAIDFSRKVGRIFKSNISPQEKISSINKLTEDYIELNNKLSEKHGKDKDTGDFAKTLNSFKERLDEMKKEDVKEELSEEMKLAYKSSF